MKKYRRIFIVVGLCLFCLAAGYFLSWKNNFSLYKTLPEKTGAEIFKECSPAVVTIQTNAGSGSGFIIDKDGLIVTNYHVVASPSGKLENIVVTLKTGEQFRPTSVLDHHPIKDLCILKISSRKKLPYIPLGDETKIEIGEKLYVIGNPLGMAYTISDGILSQFQGQYYREMLQFTCPISPGSSGGPILDNRGRVIGVVAEYLYPTDGTQAQNLNLGIVISEVKKLVKDPHEISLEDFFELTSDHAGFMTQVNDAYAQPYMEESFRKMAGIFDKRCTSLDRRDCFYLFMEKLRLSAAISRSCNAQLTPGMTEDKMSSLSQEELAKYSNNYSAEMEWTNQNYHLVENNGGWEKVSDLYKKLFAPANHTWELVMDQAVCYGYQDKAVQAATVEEAEPYFKKYEACTTFKDLVKQVHDQILLRPSHIGKTQALPDKEVKFQKEDMVGDMTTGTLHLYSCPLLNKEKAIPAEKTEGYVKCEACLR